MFDEALTKGQLPAAHREAVQRFAGMVGLNAQHVLDGKRFDYKGIPFRIDNYGALDPDGLYIIAEVGALSEGEQDFTSRRLLELNVVMPGSRFGYFGLMPGSQTIVHCLRVDLARTAEVHETIAAIMESMSSQLESTIEALSAAADKMGGESERNAEKLA